MESSIAYAVVCIAALLVSALNLPSGFGLGTVLVPVFAIFFPIGIAVALGAIVHLLNSSSNSSWWANGLAGRQ